MQSIDVYIDGSFLYGSRDAGSGVWWGHSDPRNLSLKCPGNIWDNNGAELYAVVGFLEQIGATQSCDQVPPEVTHFNLNTDSIFVIISLDICRPTWKKYGWRNQTKRPIAYEGMIRYIDSLVENARLQRDVHITFTYVPAHRDITGNCGADYLAGRASHSTSWTPHRRIWQKLEYDVRGFMAATMVGRGVPLSSPKLIEVEKHMRRAWDEGIELHGRRVMGHEDPYRLALRPAISDSTTRTTSNSGCTPTPPSSGCVPIPLAIPYSSHTTVTNVADCSQNERHASARIIAELLSKQLSGKNVINEDPSSATPPRMPTPPATPPTSRKRSRIDLDVDLQEEVEVAQYLYEKEGELEPGEILSRRPIRQPLYLNAPVYSPRYCTPTRDLPYRKQRKTLSARCQSLIPNFVDSKAFWPQTPPEAATLWIKRLLEILPQQKAMPARKKRRTNNGPAQPVRDHVVSDFMALIARLELELKVNHCTTPLRFVFVCRHDVPSDAVGLLDYIPHLTARVNAGGAGNIRLITLPKGSRQKLIEVLNITPEQPALDRALCGSIIAIEDNATGMSLLTSILDSSEHHC